jgi:hypothetical protein
MTNARDEERSRMTRINCARMYADQTNSSRMYADKSGTIAARLTMITQPIRLGRSLAHCLHMPLSALALFVVSASSAETIRLIRERLS